MEQSLRYNEGKPQWSLVDFKSLEPMVRVMEYGCQKYTSKKDVTVENILRIIQLWKQLKYVRIVAIKDELLLKDYALRAIDLQHNQLQNVQNAEKKDNLEVRDYAELVWNEKDLINFLKKDPKETYISLNIEKDLTLKKEKDLEVLKEEQTKDTLNKLNEAHFLEILNSTELQKIFIFKNVAEVVEYVETLKDYTLIMIIKQDYIEEYYVVNATTQLDCLMIIFNLLKKLNYISKKTIVENYQIINSGRENWKKGLDLTQILESLSRHLFALMSGEIIDSESQQEHIGHIMANAMFYKYHYEKGYETGYNTPIFESPMRLGYRDPKDFAELIPEKDDITPEQSKLINKVRQETMSGMQDAKKALMNNNWDYKLAVSVLKKNMYKGILYEETGKEESK
jgi:hypothetical protein